MNWEKWVLISWFAFGNLLVVARVGQQRKPLESGDAVLGIIISALLILCVVAS